MNNKILDILKKHEIILHNYENRINQSKLKELLDESFIEIWYSGSTHTYDSTLADLLNEHKTEYVIWSQDYSCIELKPDLFILNYLEARLDQDGVLSRHAKRTSIWSKSNNKWKMKFHQATPVSEFKKSNIST